MASDGSGAKILLLDIETAPSRAFIWSLRPNWTHHDAVEEPGYTLCWAAKWLGKKQVLFSSIRKDGREKMLDRIYALLEEADIVIHYNGSKFDIPMLNKEFLESKRTPPAPFAEIDLLKTCRSRFRLLSNKLDYVLQFLGHEGKIKHKGMQLWKGCMDGRAADWKEMESYNKQDVVILETLYNELLPWIQHHPNLALYEKRPRLEDDLSRPACTNCGGRRVEKRGLYRSSTRLYQRFKCVDCGKYMKGNRSEPSSGAVVSGVR